MSDVNEQTNPAPRADVTQTRKRQCNESQCRYYSAVTARSTQLKLHHLLWIRFLSDLFQRESANESIKGNRKLTMLPLS